MGAAASNYMFPPTETVVFDMYGGRGVRCDYSNQCTAPSFEHAQYKHEMETMMSQADFMSFKQRVCGVTQNYRAWRVHIIVPVVVFLMIIPFVVGSVLGFAGYHVPFFFVAFGGFLYFRSRIIKHNNLVDDQIRAICDEFNSSHLAGRATIRLMTQHTGMCVPKHAHVVRQVWLSSATNSGTHHQQQQQYPAVGGAPAQPQTMTMTTAVPGYPHTMPGGQAKTAYPMGQQQPPPPPPPQNYNYSTSAYPPPPPYGHNQTASAAYPAPPTDASSPPAAQKEVFYVKVPKAGRGVTSR